MPATIGVIFVFDQPPLTGWIIVCRNVNPTTVAFHGFATSGTTLSYPVVNMIDHTSGFGLVGPIMSGAMTSPRVAPTTGDASAC